MTTERIEREFREKVSDQVRLVSEGMNRYRIFTPFRFEDGDHLSITMRQADTKWTFSDEAHTYMHLTYDIDEQDLHRGTRQKIISNALSAFHVEDRDGELLLDVPDEQYGDALFGFIQALLRITNVSYLSREITRSTFQEDFRELFADSVPETRRSFDWHESVNDPQGKYMVDCRINGMERPLLVHALRNDDTTRDATISLLQFEKWGMAFRSLAVFEDQESINRKVLARFSDVSEKQFSSIAGSNRERITNYVTEQLQSGSA